MYINYEMVFPVSSNPPGRRQRLAGKLFYQWAEVKVFIVIDSAPQK